MRCARVAAVEMSMFALSCQAAALLHAQASLPPWEESYVVPATARVPDTQTLDSASDSWVTKGCQTGAEGRRVMAARCRGAVRESSELSPTVTGGTGVGNSLLDISF